MRWFTWDFIWKFVTLTTFLWLLFVVTFGGYRAVVANKFDADDWASIRWVGGQFAIYIPPVLFFLLRGRISKKDLNELADWKQAFQKRADELNDDELLDHIKSLNSTVLGKILPEKK